MDPPPGSWLFRSGKGMKFWVFSFWNRLKFRSPGFWHFLRNQKNSMLQSYDFAKLSSFCVFSKMYRKSHSPKIDHFLMLYEILSPPACWFTTRMRVVQILHLACQQLAKFIAIIQGVRHAGERYLWGGPGIFSIRGGLNLGGDLKFKGVPTNPNDAMILWISWHTEPDFQFFDFFWQWF